MKNSPILKENKRRTHTHAKKKKKKTMTKYTTLSVVQVT